MQTRDRYVVYGENKRFATLLDVAGKRGLDLQEAGGEDEVEEREDEQDALRLPYGRRTSFDRNVPYLRRQCTSTPGHDAPAENTPSARGSFANHPTYSLISSFLLCLFYVLTSVKAH